MKYYTKVFGDIVEVVPKYYDPQDRQVFCVVDNNSLIAIDVHFISQRPRFQKGAKLGRAYNNLALHMERKYPPPPPGVHQTARVEHSPAGVLVTSTDGGLP